MDILVFIQPVCKAFCYQLQSPAVGMANDFQKKYSRLRSNGSNSETNKKMMGPTNKMVVTHGQQTPGKQNLNQKANNHFFDHMKTVAW